MCRARFFYFWCSRVQSTISDPAQRLAADSACHPRRRGGSLGPCRSGAGARGEAAPARGGKEGGKGRPGPPAAGVRRAGRGMGQGASSHALTQVDLEDLQLACGGKRACPEDPKTLNPPLLPRAPRPAPSRPRLAAGRVPGTFGTIGSTGAPPPSRRSASSQLPHGVLRAHRPQLVELRRVLGQLLHATPANARPVQTPGGCRRSLPGPPAPPGRAGAPRLPGWLPGARPLARVG